MKKTIQLLFITFCVMNCASQQVDTTSFSKKYHHRKSVYEMMPNKKGEIVFLGNSITEQGTWRELFQNNHIINRGIGGDTTDGVLYRLDEVTVSKPDKIFLLIGTNDLRDGKSPDYIVNRIKQIVVKIKKDSPNTLIYLQSVLPTYNRAERPNKAIIAINEGMKIIASEEKVNYINLFSEFIDSETQELEKKYSLDGLHLNGKGYVKWKGLIEGYVNDSSGKLKKTIRLLQNPSNDYVLVTAHRGDWRNAPENSLQSIKNSIEMGVDIVEIDLQMTKDSIIVLMHDNTIDRTTTGTGKIKDHTYDELKALFLKNVLGKVTHHKIPTLKEALKLAKCKIVLDLDIKKTMPFQRVADILIETNTTSQTIVRSYRTIEEAKTYYGSILNTMIYIPGISKNLDYLNYFNEWENTINPVYYAPKFETDSEPLALFLKTISNTKNGIWVHSITASRSGGHDDELAVTNPDAAWGWLIDNSVDIIQTDRPTLLIDYLRSRNLHE